MADHTEHVHVLMNKETRGTLRALAKKQAKSEAEIIRRLIERAGKSLARG